MTGKEATDFISIQRVVFSPSEAWEYFQALMRPTFFASIGSVSSNIRRKPNGSWACNELLTTISPDCAAEESLAAMLIASPMTPK